MSPISFLVVDDSLEFLGQACQLLADDCRVTVIGTAANGAEALEVARRLLPEVVLMDVNMPVMNGLDAARRLKTDANGPRVMLMSLDGYPTLRIEAAKLGADGCISKTDFGNAIASYVLSLVEKRSVGQSDFGDGKSALPPASEQPNV